MITFGGIAISYVVVWLLVFVVMLIFEFATMGLTTIWFAGGALASALATMLGANLFVQVGLFIVISLLLMIGVKPLAQKRFNSNRTQTNIGTLAGQEGKVIGAIDNDSEKGVVLLNGMEWTARSLDGLPIEIGEIVTVVSVSGVKLIVTLKG